MKQEKKKPWKQTEIRECSDCGEKTQAKEICYSCLDERENSFRIELRKRYLK